MSGVHIDPHEDLHDLTDEQAAVVRLPADALTLVTAAAGTGKTHTLVRRLDHLITEEGLGAGAEILVLTFARSAVHELHQRLAAQGTAARSIRARTFDSWALDLLMQVDADTAWHEKGFKARIDAAAKALADGRADELLADLRHVVIDEVQDLVGERRALVETLLDEFDCGFTVVGDISQSVYGFTVHDPIERAGETGRFMDWLRSSFDSDLTELELTRNFRAASNEAKAALPFGPLLRTGTPADMEDRQVIYARLRSELLDRLDFGALDEFAADTLTGHEGTTAVLCRTNGQALEISGTLADLGVPHRLRRAATDRVAPAWIGHLFAVVDGSLLSRRRFEELVGSPPFPQETPPVRLWTALARNGVGDDRTLDMGRLRRALATGSLPDELTAQPTARLLISSCHRAKGLEFDRVLVVDPGPLPNLRADDEPTRLLYVAMTRARNELYRLDTPDCRFVRVDRATGRWSRNGVKQGQRLGLELTSVDVHTDHPAGFQELDYPPMELQTYLSTQVHEGDRIVIERLDEPTTCEMAPDYTILHGGRPIGTVSDRLRTDLRTYMGPRAWSWPRRLTGVRIDAVETVTGGKAAGLNAGLGPHGVWLVPRLAGLSRFVYDHYVKEEDAGVPA